jgi:hypothetical protein
VEGRRKDRAERASQTVGMIDKEEEASNRNKRCIET